MSDSVGSVSVEVVPDARGWSEKLRAQIRDQRATVNVDADTGEAEAQIDEVARTRTAKVKVDTDKSVGDLVKNVSLLPALFVAASAAAVPLAAAVGGIAAALAAPLLIGGGGLGLFAIFGGLAAKQTETQLKNIDSLKKKLDGLTKGTQDYTDTQKQLRDAQAALTPAQKDFASSLSGLQGAFTTLLAGKGGQALLSTIAGGMDLLSKSLPVVAPLLADASGALDPLLRELGDAAQSKGFAHFIDQFGRLAGRDITSGAHILGNLTKGIGGLLLLFDKHLSGHLLDDLERLSGSFADFGTDSHGKVLKEFFDYFHRVGPQVGDTIGAVAGAVGHLVRALAPLGPPVLRIIQGIADAISSIPTGTLTALLAATAGVSVAGYGAKKVNSVTGLLSNIPGIGGSGLGGKGVVPVYVTNKGFGAGGGLPGGTGGTSTLGKIANTIPIAATLYGAYKIGQARGDAETRAMGGLDLAHYEQLQLQQKLQAAGLSGKTRTVVGGPFNLAVPVGQSTRSLTSTTTLLDAVKQHAAQASQELDRIGPNASASLAGAIRSVGTLSSKVDALHDKKFTIIAQTQTAIASLERLQAYRIQNKSFTVYQRSQALDRTVGPGGGIGTTPHTGGGGSSSGGGSGRTAVHVHLDDSGKHTLSGFMEGTADRVYHANRGYEDQAAGR